MVLIKLSDEALLSETKAYVAREREMTLAVLHRLREVERRRLYVKEGYSSLFAFATEELGYDSASATRRIDAMHLLVELPEIEQKIQDGTLNLTHVSRAESFFRKEPVALEKKKEIVAALESKTTRQAEKTLLQFSKTPFVHLREKIKPVTPELSEVLFYANDEVLEQLERLKGLLAHSHPGMSTGDLIAYLARMGLERLDPALRKGQVKKGAKMSDSEASKDTKVSKDSGPSKKKGDQARSEAVVAPLKKPGAVACAPGSVKTSSEAPSSAPNESVRQEIETAVTEGALFQEGLINRSEVKLRPTRSRRPPAPMLREVWKRDGGRCVWRNPETGKVCGSSYFVQVDHIFPWALGGDHSPSNLRCFYVFSITDWNPRTGLERARNSAPSWTITPARSAASPTGSPSPPPGW